MRKLNALFAAVLMTALLARPAAGQGLPVTSEGFADLSAKSTLYLPVTMDGIVGRDCPADAVKAALSAAAKDKHIKHAVFMVDSERGWLIEREHVGIFAGKLEITAVVRNAIAPAIFPVFFADHIYMTEGALIGGLALSQYVPQGSEEVTAKQIGIFSSMLASAAQSRGHHEAIAYAMIDEKKDLYYWRESSKPVLSNDRPDNPQGLTGFKQITSAVSSLTLLIDQATAVQIGLAKPIDDFDAMIVGEYLGKDNWLPANRFARVCNEIGMVIAECKGLRDDINEWDKRFPQIKVERRNNSDEDEGYKAFKRNLDRAVDRLGEVVDALEKVYEVHPERYAYFTAPDGRTIVADEKAWASDATEALRYYAQASGTLRQLISALDTIAIDEEWLYDTNKRMEKIGEHLQGIRRYGNAAYWAEHAEPKRPDDIYG